MRSAREIELGAEVHMLRRVLQRIAEAASEARSPQQIASCACCGGAFFPKRFDEDGRPMAKFCSSRCRSKAHLERRALELAEKMSAA
jgi:hypothetical protein